jgi:RNA polymerase sigma-70 factor (ECF subfamily)
MATANMESLVANASMSQDDAPAENPADGTPAAAAFALGPDFVRRHQDDVWWYLRFLGCQEAEASDLAQETFLAVLRKPPTDLGPAALRVFLRTVARNKFVESLRKHRREAEFDLDAAEQAWAATQTTATQTAEGSDAWLEALGDCVEQLDGRAKQVIDLTYRENKSRADIAATIDMTESGVKSLLRRTREILRQCVERKVNATTPD